MNALARPAGSLVRVPAAALRPTALPKLLVRMADDVHSMAASTRELTETVRQLAMINQRLAATEDEVTRMRASVESMGADVVAIREATAPLGRLGGRIARRRRAAAAPD